MRKRSETSNDEQSALRERILGFGEASFRKSYYPELRVRLLELERFRFTLDQIDIGIMILDPRDGTIIDLNEETCHILRKKKKELIGVKLPEYSDQMARLFSTIQKKDRVITIIEDLSPSDSIPYSIEVTNHHAIFGEEEYLIVILRDITENRRVEAENEASRIRLKTLFDFLPDPTFAVDHEGHVTHWNHEMEKMTGVDAKDVIGMGGYAYSMSLWRREVPLLVHSIISQEEPDPTRYPNLIREGDNLVTEINYRSREKGLQHILVKAAPIIDTSGTLIGAVETLRNLSSIRRTEEALKETETRIQEITDNIPGIVYQLAVTKENGIQIRYMSRRGYTILGMDAFREKEKIIDCFHQEDLADVFKQVTRDRNGTGYWQGMIRAHKPDGQPLWLGGTSNSRLLHDGSEIWNGVLIDITAQKSAEHALIRTKDMFESVIRISHIQDATEGGILSEALLEAVTLTGSRSGMCSILSLDEQFFIIHSSNQQTKEKVSLSRIGRSGPWERVIRERSTIIHNETRRIDIPIMERNRIVAIITLEGKADHYDDFDSRQITYLGDALWQVILRHRAEEELRRLNEELERRVEERTRELEVTNSELEAFTYSVSHDLRTPLRSVDGFSLALLEDFLEILPPDAQEYLGRIRMASQRMGDLIDDLLLLSRLSRAELRYEEFSISDLAKEVIAEIERINPRKNMSISIEEEMIVTADRRMIRIVLENLFGNAWKFTGKKERGEIAFHSTNDGINTTYVISDNGAGFDMTYAGKLFIPFSRLHTSEEFPGTGIGLATVARIIQKHGGTIQAEAERGRGATIYFTVESKRK